MAITKPWTVSEEPLTAEPVPLADLSKPIPSWNTPEYPAEWPRSDETSVAPRHSVILRYLFGALSTLLRRRGHPFAVNQEIGLHFIDARGQAQRCDPDLIVMPFPNTGEGSLRRWDMPCPPDCVIEVASSSTVANDLGFKKDWYAGMGVREYWILDPVDSKDPSHFERGLLLPDGPMRGWRLEQGRYEPLDTFWDAGPPTRGPPTRRPWIVRSSFRRHCTGRKPTAAIGSWTPKRASHCPATVRKTNGWWRRMNGWWHRTNGWWHRMNYWWRRMSTWNNSDNGWKTKLRKSPSSSPTSRGSVMGIRLRNHYGS